MKSKRIIKILTTGLCCLMLTLSISNSALNHNPRSTNSHTIHVDVDMPHD